MIKKAKVLVASYTIPEEAIRILRSQFDVRVCEAKKDAILLNIPGVDGLFWSSHLRLDDEILDKAGPQLKAVGVMSAGYDHINTSELQRRGIKLGNTPIVLNDAVADIAVLLCLAASRRIVEARIAIEESRWSFDNGTQWMLGQEISESTVGIVGLGGVGVTIVRRLKGFNVNRFLYTGHGEKPEGATIGAEFVGLDYLLTNSDFVFACVPLTSETENMFNARFFSLMKRTAVFVNVSRGATVNQNDLIAALKENKIFAAGLDVMTPEPLPSDHELLKLPNCVITPHLGSATKKTRENMAILTAKNISNALNGTLMETPVVW
ncbi:hypothetical protein WA026_001568 [Henosepilachna vigintioctopunctata]|uniref:Glyoxylate reductase/hydroxypyruvate reductase n=1 Tax=Henosepilachna vigintioctopunctata TaxID=420089 RepID=A0AAW1UQA8_9CUCU